MLKNEQKFELVKEKQKNAEKTQETMLKKTGKMQKNQMLKKTWHNSGPPWTTPTNTLGQNYFGKTWHNTVSPH